MRVIWSIHDVSPETVAWADNMVVRLTSSGASPLMILIIPAGDWPSTALDVVGGWESAGHILALHGWDHQALRPNGVYHRLHSLMLSRDAAEHLSRDRAEMLTRIDRGRKWFESNGLREPAVYVPPAWALGAVRATDLEEGGFRWVETLTGIHDAKKGKQRLLPLVGFEADNAWRSAALRVSNAVNLAITRATGSPIRVAIHPHDDAGLLAHDLDRWIRRGCRAVLPARVDP
jgi:hypothetical protein